MTEASYRAVGAGVALLIGGPGLGSAQRGGPALAACTVPHVDTSGWKQFASDIAPISFFAPADFSNWSRDPSIHHYRGSTAPGAPRPRASLERTTEHWSGQTPPYDLDLLRAKYQANSRPLSRAPPSSQVRELTYCRDTIGGLAVVIFSDRRIEAKIIGTDTSDVYEVGGALAVAENDTLYVTGVGDDPAEEALALVIVRSVRIKRSP
jgi:hypothetical protein